MTHGPNIRLGMLTPSSNTALEPITAAILQGQPHISAHFARLKVTEISVSDEGLAQFDSEPISAAASLLSDARPHSLVWNGTSGGWRGAEADLQMKRLVENQHSIPFSTVTLSLIDLLKRNGIKAISFVTPYTTDVQQLIISTFKAQGFDCRLSPCLGISENFAFNEVSVPQMERLVDEAMTDRPEAIVPFCTNFPATRYAPLWEERFDVLVVDSIALAAYEGLRLAGVSPRSIDGWGRIFSL